MWDPAGVWDPAPLRAGQAARRPRASEQRERGIVIHVRRWTIHPRVVTAMHPASRPVLLPRAQLLSRKLLWLGHAED